MFSWLWSKYEEWKWRRWVKQRTITVEELERKLEALYGIPRDHSVQ